MQTPLCSWKQEERLEAQRALLTLCWKSVNRGWKKQTLVNKDTYRCLHPFKQYRKWLTICCTRSATNLHVREARAVPVFVGCHTKIKTKTSLRTLFLKTLTQKSAGYDMAGLELKVWSTLEDSKAEGLLDFSTTTLLILWLSSWLNSLSLLDQVNTARWFNVRNEPKWCPFPPPLGSFQSLVRVYFHRNT